MTSASASRTAIGRRAVPGGERKLSICQPSMSTPQLSELRIFADQQARIGKVAPQRGKLCVEAVYLRNHAACREMLGDAGTKPHRSDFCCIKISKRSFHCPRKRSRIAGRHKARRKRAKYLRYPTN